MDAKSRLERFIFLSSFEPVFRTKIRPIEYTENVRTQLQEVTLAINGDEFVKLLQNALKHSRLPRRDELWLAYAHYIFCTTAETSKIQVSQAFPTLASTDEDLFLFIKYAKIVAIEKSLKVTSNIVKRVVVLWYQSKSPEELVDMLSVHRGMHKFTHKDLLVMFHVNMQTLLRDSAITSAILKRANQVASLDAFEKAETLPPLQRKIVELNFLKWTEDAKKILPIIAKHKLQPHHIPTHLLKSVEVWQKLIPNMSYLDLMKSSHYLIDANILNNVAFSKMYLRAIGNRDLMLKENIHPVVFLFEKSMLVKHQRYSGDIKVLHYRKKVEKNKIEANPFLNNKISKICEHCFDNFKGMGVRTFVTITLQQRMGNLPNKKQVSCFDAALTMAFSYFKSEQDSVVYTFTNDKLKLAKVNLKTNMSFKKATDLWQTMAALQKSTSQRNHLPIMEALKLKQIFDLFLIVVLSAGRGNPHDKSDFLLQMFQKYKDTKNKKAKLVILNLRKLSPTMKHPMNRADGILEICGLNENTPKLINAFVMNDFN